MSTVGDIAKVGSSIASVGSGFSGLLGLASGLGSLFGKGGSMSQEDIMKWQESMMQKQFDFQSAEAQKSRDFSAQQADIARKWDSIGSQVSRALAAGINPNYLAAGSSYGQASSPSPTGAMASGGVSIPSAPPMQGAEKFNLIANGLASLANARQSDANTDRTRQLLGAELRKLISEGNLNEVLVRVNKVVADNLPKKYDKEFAKLQAETDLLIKQGNLTEKQIDNLIEEWRQLCYKTEVMQIFGDDFWKQFKSLVLQEKGAKIQNLQADTALKGEQAITEGSKRAVNSALIDYYGSQEKLNDSMRQLNDLSYKVRNATSANEIKANASRYLAEIENNPLIPQITRESLRNAIKNNDWYEVNAIIDNSTKLANSVANFVP